MCLGLGFRQSGKWKMGVNFRTPMGRFSENIQVYQNHTAKMGCLQNGYVEIAIHTQLLCTRSLSCEKRSETSWSGNSNSAKTKAGMCELLVASVFPRVLNGSLGMKKWVDGIRNSSQL